LANHKSAEKRSKQSDKRRLRNTTIKSEVKTDVKRVIASVEEKDKDGAKAALAKSVIDIQKASAKGVLHKKTSSRKISRLTRKVNTLLA
jgi:small subunit ribosomal protein S20